MSYTLSFLNIMNYFRNFIDDHSASLHIEDVRFLLDFRLADGVVGVIRELESDVNNRFNILRVLEIFCRDFDFSYDLGKFGGHFKLKRLLQGDDSTIQNLTGEVISSIITTGCYFPMKVDVGSKDTRIPSSFTFQDRAEIPSSISPVLTMYVRTVPKPMHGIGQHAVGFILWSSATILSRIIIILRNLFRRKTVLELGSGLGLSGLVAARYASHTYLTDFNDEVLCNLDYNIRLNKGSTLVAGNVAAIPSDRRVEVFKLDFSQELLSSNVMQLSDSPLTTTESIPLPKFPNLPNNIQADILIGADVICCASDAEAVARCVLTRLRRNGIALLVLPGEFHRFGVDSFTSHLQTYGLKVTSVILRHSKSESPMRSSQPDEYLDIARKITGYIDIESVQDTTVVLENIHKPLLAALTEGDSLYDNLEEAVCVSWQLFSIIWN